MVVRTVGDNCRKRGHYPYVLHDCNQHQSQQPQPDQQHASDWDSPHNNHTTTHLPILQDRDHHILLPIPLLTLMKWINMEPNLPLL